MMITVKQYKAALEHAIFVCSQSGESEKARKGLQDSLDSIVDFPDDELIPLANALSILAADVSN